MTSFFLIIIFAYFEIGLVTFAIKNHDEQYLTKLNATYKRLGFTDTKIRMIVTFKMIKQVVLWPLIFRR